MNNPLTAPIAGTQLVRVVASVSPEAEVESVPATTETVTLLKANPHRVGAIVYNDSPGRLYLKFGPGASDTSHTVALTAHALYEVPYGFPGELSGVWSQATGSARVTEVVTQEP